MKKITRKKALEISESILKKAEKERKPVYKLSGDPKFAVVYKSRNKSVRETFYRLVDAILYWIRNTPDAFIEVEGIRVDPKGHWLEFKQAIERFDRDQDVIVQMVKKKQELKVKMIREEAKNFGQPDPVTIKTKDGGKAGLM